MLCYVFIHQERITIGNVSLVVFVILSIGKCFTNYWLQQIL